MDADEGIINGNGREHGEVGQCSKNGQANNGLAISSGSDAGEGSSGASEGIQTYKRRKTGKLSSDDKALEDGRPFQEAASNLADQTVNDLFSTFIDDNSCAHSNVPKTDCHNITNGSDSHRSQRNVLLNCIYESLGANKGGIEGCIHDALVFQQEDSRPVQNFIHIDECKEKCSSQTCQLPKHMDGNGSTSGENQHSVTELCRRAFYNIIISEKFTLLCQLLFENFKGCEVHSLFDLNLINLRMREGAYEGSPVQFSSDVQQIWKRLHDIGSELTSLAKDLSDVSRTSCHAQFPTVALYPVAKPEQIEGCGVHGVCACRCCGQKADGRDCLVCDSCEEMYHVSCIKPAVKEIPPSWYCGKCLTSGMGSPHDNCAICDRLNAPRIIISSVGENAVPTNEETLGKIEENSTCSMEEEIHLSSGSKNVPLCKICGNEVEQSESFSRCGHPYCPNEYYHVRCLTPKQLKSYGPRWYCPSCLCRACLTDQDDDKIVLCDGCDHAYHMYCTEPRLARIPEGKWFCRKCGEGIKKIRRAKRAYEEYEKKQKEITEEGERVFESFGKKEDEREASKGQEGMDMLLSAAKKLNYEENIVDVNM